MKSNKKSTSERQGRKDTKAKEQSAAKPTPPTSSAPDDVEAQPKDDRGSKESGVETSNDGKEQAVAVAEDRLLRLQADFDNYRKRVLREKEEIYRRANEDIMEALLPVVDHLDLAIKAATSSEQHPSIAEGIALVGEQMLSVLGKFGLEPIETEDVDFDPNMHEAILHMPSVDVKENGIISTTRAGFTLGGKLLRAAQVVVSSGDPDEENNAKQNDE